LPAIVTPTITILGGLLYIATGNQYVTSCPVTGGGSLSRIFTDIFSSPLSGVGPLSFWAAKGIDVAWDLVVGRGGQLLLFWITGCVYTAVLDQVLESKSPNVAYDLYISVAISGSSLALIGALVQRLLTTASFWAKICFMLYSALYVAAFPTLIAAMTSYIAKTVPRVETPNGTIVELRNNFGFYPTTEPYTLVDGTKYSKDYIIQHCDNTIHLDQYVYSIAPWIWIAVCILQLIWSFGMYGLWVDASRKSQLHRAGRRLGPYRGILDIAEAIQNDLGPDTCAYSDAELRKAIKKRSSARGLSYSQLSHQSPKHLTISPSKTDGRTSLSLNSEDLYGSTREV